MSEIIIRDVTEDDALALLKIYAYYVTDTAITFEYDVPSEEEFKRRIINIKKRYPYICITKDDRILGYAYAGVFKDRRAYDHCVEVTIYLDRDARGEGLGRRLYEELEARLKTAGFLNLYACIGYPITPDEYLDDNSAKFHEHLGYEKVGRFHKCGYKFDRWYDMIWMEKEFQWKKI